MNKNIRVQEGQINHRLVAFLLDLLTLFATTVALYFILLFCVFSPIFHYSENKNKVEQIEIQYNLNLKDGLAYKEYENVLKDFYFNQFPNEIENHINSMYTKQYTITHIYNVLVLQLNDSPTYESYNNGLFSYVQASDGTFDPNILAIKMEGNGSTYEKNMYDVFHGAYQDLPTYLEFFNNDYNALKVKIFTHEAIARSISFGLSILLFYIIIPLSNKNSSTIFDKVYKLGHVNTKDGYLIKKYKVILRPFVYFTIPFIAFAIGNRNSIIIVLIGYLFINFLLLIFSSKNLDIADKLLKISTCSTEESLLFKNEKDEKEFFETEEGKKILDPDYLNKLSNVSSFNLTVSRDEELKNHK